MGRFAIPVTMAWSMASLWGCEQMVQVLDMATYSEGIAPTRPKLSFLGPHTRLSPTPQFSAPHALKRLFEPFFGTSLSNVCRPGSFSEPSFLQVSMQFLLAFLLLCSFLLLCAEACLDTSGGRIVTRDTPRTLGCFQAHFRSLDLGDCCSPLAKALGLTMVIRNSSFAALCQLQACLSLLKSFACLLNRVGWRAVCSLADGFERAPSERRGEILCHDFFPFLGTAFVGCMWSVFCASLRTAAMRVASGGLRVYFTVAISVLSCLGYEATRCGRWSPSVNPPESLYASIACRSLESACSHCESPASISARLPGLTESSESAELSPGSGNSRSI